MSDSATRSVRLCLHAHAFAQSTPGPGGTLFLGRGVPMGL